MQCYSTDLMENNRTRQTTRSRFHLRRILLTKLENNVAEESSNNSIKEEKERKKEGRQRQPITLRCRLLVINVAEDASIRFLYVCRLLHDQSFLEATEARRPVFPAATDDLRRVVGAGGGLASPAFDTTEARRDRTDPRRPLSSPPEAPNAVEDLRRR